MTVPRRAPLRVVAALVLVCAACSDRLTPEERLGSDLIAAHGCGACHVVPGVRGARGLVGPPLNAFGRRVLVAGKLPNTRSSLAAFIMAPQRVEPGTAMPNLDVSARDAAAIAAYLHTLR